MFLRRKSSNKASLSRDPDGSARDIEGSFRGALGESELGGSGEDLVVSGTSDSHRNLGGSGRNLNITEKDSGIGEFESRNNELLDDVKYCCSPFTQEGLVPDDPSVNRAVASLLETNNPELLEKVLRYLCSELKSSSHKVVMLTLSTIGFLMRADHATFQRMLCVKGGILKQMTHMIDAKKKTKYRDLSLVEQADLCLQLIECWAETIQGENDTKEIITLYQNLKKKDWLRWPPRNHLYDCDVHIAGRSVSLDPGAPPPSRKPFSMRPSSLRTFATANTEWMRKDFDNFDAIITTLEAELARCENVNDVEENDLIQEIVKECDKIGPQLRSMIEIISLSTQQDPTALQPALELNDRLLNSLDQYKLLLATPATKSESPANKFALPPPPGPARQKTPPITVSSEKSYNPFDDEDLLAQVFSQLSATSNKSVNVTPQKSPEQEVDFIVFSPSPAKQLPVATAGPFDYFSSNENSTTVLNRFEEFTKELDYHAHESATTNENPFDMFANDHFTIGASELPQAYQGRRKSSLAADEDLL